MKIEGKVAVVTGAAQGIGLAICEALLEKGGKVCMADIATEKGHNIVQKFTTEYGEGKAFFSRCDVKSEEDIKWTLEETKKRFGRIDIVCNHAQASYMIDVSVGNAIKLALDVLGKDKGGDGGIIINTASMAAFHQNPWLPQYAASKAATVHFTRCYAHPKHFRNHGVRLYSLCPTATSSPSFIASLDPEFAHKLFLLPDDYLAEMKIYQQNGLVTTPSEVAAGVIQVIDEEDGHRNGGAFTILPNKGMRYINKPEITFEEP